MYRITHQSRKTTVMLQPIRRRDATGLVARVYEAIDQDFFLAPPLSLHSPSPELLAAVWTVFREIVLCGEAPRAWKETIAAAVARANRCPFCIEAHTMFLHGLGAHDEARWLAAEAETQAPEGELAAIGAWASAVRTPGAAVLRDPPFGDRWAPELVATAAAFHYVTTMATVFLDTTPIPRGFRWMSGTVRRVGGAVLSSRLDRPLPPGVALDLLPGAPLPCDLSWAAPNPPVAGAMARLAATVEVAGARALPSAARQRVQEAVDAWHGEAPPLGGAWIDGLFDRAPALEAGDRKPARLAVLGALAPERITEEDLRGGSDGAASSLEAVAWSAFASARRVAAWMRGPY